MATIDILWIDFVGEAVHTVNIRTYIIEIRQSIHQSVTFRLIPESNAKIYRFTSSEQIPYDTVRKHLIGWEFRG